MTILTKDAEGESIKGLWVRVRESPASRARRSINAETTCFSAITRRSAANSRARFPISDAAARLR